MDKLTLHERLLRRKSALWTDRSQWDAEMKEIARYIYPEGGRWSLHERNRNQRTFGDTINNHAWIARRTLSAGLMAGASSPARPWFRVTTPDADLADYDSVRQWLHSVGSLMRDVFARSNTYQTLQLIYNELSAFSTAANVLYDDFDHVIWHQPHTFGEYALATDFRRRVNTFVREVPYTVWEMVQEFGLENVSLSVRNQYDRGNYDHRVPVMHIIEPRPENERDRSIGGARNMPFRSTWFEPNGPSGVVLRDSGFRKFPVLAPRWMTIAGDTYGSGLGAQALGDVIHLQFLEKRKAKAIDYQSDPPVQVPSTLKDADLLPGGVSFYDQTTAGGGIRSAYEVKLDTASVREDILQTQQRIDRVFYVDLFLMLASMDTGRELTAREVAERHEEKLLMLGPVMENLHTELFGPLIELTFDRLVRTGLLPTPPMELQDQELKIEFVSTLAQAQKAIGLQAIDRLLGTVGAIAQQRPEAWDKVDTDKVIDLYADMLGADPDAIVANDRVAIVRQDRAQQQQAAQNIQMGAEMAKGAKDLASADTSGQNALTDVVSMFSQ
jgi:hypothetical protein